MNEEVRAAGAVAKEATLHSSQFWSLIWLGLLATWGGVVRVMREVNLGEQSWRKLAWIFISEMLISGFVGVMTYLGCQALHIPENYTAVLVGISGWMGVRALNVFEQMWKAAFRPKGE